MSRDSHKLLLTLLLMMGALLLAPAYSQQPADAQQQEEYTEEEYDAYEKATKEADLDKRVDMLNAFMEKYPKSKLQPYIDRSYQDLMYQYHQAQNWAKLGPLAERWLKSHPDDLQAIDYVAASAQNLGQHEKFIEYGLKVFNVKPTKEYVYFIAQAYKKLGNEAKYLEWTEKSFQYFPENFAIRMEFVEKYVKEKNFGKAAEYAQLVQESMKQAKKPETTSDADWQKAIRETRKSTNFVIGLNHYERDRFPAAIKSLEATVAIDKRFAPAYYYIAHSQWKLGQVDEAIESFCKAVILKGETEAQAKEHMENLYKSLHNNTLIGIEKVYRRNRQELGLQPENAN